MSNEEIERKIAMLPDEYWATKRYLTGLMKTAAAYKEANFEQTIVEYGNYLKIQAGIEPSSVEQTSLRSVEESDLTADSDEDISSLANAMSQMDFSPEELEKELRAAYIAAEQEKKSGHSSK